MQGSVMNVGELLIRASDLPVAITPEDAGWSYVSFRVETLSEGGVVEDETGSNEMAIVPLAGMVEARSEDQNWRFGGRTSVFAGLPAALYLPRQRSYQLRATEGPAKVAICGARAERGFDPRLITEDDYSVEIRGAGNATRQVVTLVPPKFPADRLMVVEVWTPAGNWSSYPPHKHDELRTPEEIRLEETYYFQIESPDGFAVQRLYSKEREIDQTWAVHDGDLLVVPWGYHTTAAVPGYDLHYLNVLAGDSRSLQAHEDPRHAWVRQGWAHEAADPRLPMITG